MPTLTQQQIENIINMDSGPTGNRAGGYMALWQITGSSEALLQARIASFSGGVGGVAFAANDALQEALGSKYPGIFNLSDQVFRSSMQAVSDNLTEINNGTMSIDDALFQGARNAWANAVLPDGTTTNLLEYFPANIYSLNPFSNVFSLSTGLTLGTGVAVLSGISDAAVLFGKEPDDFKGLPGYTQSTIIGLGGATVPVVIDSNGITVAVGAGQSVIQNYWDTFLIYEKEYDYSQLGLPSNREVFANLRTHLEQGSVTVQQDGSITLTAADSTTTNVAIGTVSGGQDNLIFTETQGGNPIASGVISIGPGSVTASTSVVQNNPDGTDQLSIYYGDAAQGSGSGGASIQISGANSIMPQANGSYVLTDQNGRLYTLAPVAGSLDYQLTSASGLVSVKVDPSALLVLQLGSTLTIVTTNGDNLGLNPSTGTGLLGNGTGTFGTIGQPSVIEIDPNVGSSAGLFRTAR